MPKSQFEKDRELFNALKQNPRFVEKYTGMVVAVYQGQVVHSGYVDDEVVSYAHAITGADDIFFGVIPESKEDDLSETVRP